MKDIELIIKNKNREPLYEYYKSLGYDHKVAASLSLFTYGAFRLDTLSMDELYEKLSTERGYLELEKAGEISRGRNISARVIAPESAAPESAAPKSAAPKSKSYDRKASLPSSKSNPGKEPGILSLLRSMSGRTASKEGFSQFDDSEALADCALPDSVDLPDSVALPDSAGRRAKAPASSKSASRERKGSADRLSARPSVQGLSPDLFAAVSGFATDEYESVEEKEASVTAMSPVSTFRMTTNTASAGVVLNQLRNGRRIDQDMVRIEEMLNYFRYESEMPVSEMFHISCEMMGIADNRKYLYVNVQGREDVRDHQNIVILLDISGSMKGNAEQTQAIVATIISKLGNGDRLSLVTYSSRDSVELEAMEIHGAQDRIRALEKLLSIGIRGATYGSAGIERAYQIGRDHYIEGGNNQVILLTDGDLNFGITDKGGLTELIEEKKKENLFLSVIGTGLYNYKDDKLEALSKHGNGVYRTVNNLADVKKSINEEYASLVNIIAKDVKAQVEFNPEVVESYRLLGFENRMLAREDFKNDKVISEPFGSGGYGVALYELTMKKGTAPVDSGLKYSTIVTTGSAEPGTVKIRYKEPLEEVSHEIEKVIETAEDSFTDNLRLAFVIYVCSEKLRGSDKITAEDIKLAKQFYGELGDKIREMNSSDLYKLAGILDKSEEELGIGIRRNEPFPW